MSEIPNTVQQAAADFAESRDVSTDDVLQAAEEEFDDISDSFDDDRRWRFAMKRAKKNVIKDDSMSGGGEAATIITIGHGRLSRWPDRNHEDYTEGMSKDAVPRKDVLICNAVARHEGTGNASKAVVLLDETNDIDIGHAMEMFQEPLNVLEAKFNFSEPNVSSDGNILFSTSGTQLTEAEDPPSEEECRKWVHRFVDEVDIAGIASAPMANLSLTDSNGAADFGIDIKRISEAYIVDHYIPDDDDRGVYTILDDSIVDESELDDTKLVSDSQRVSGLSCWSHTNLMQYDEGSIVDIYGVVQEGRNGQITMNVRGIEPLLVDKVNEESADNQSGESF